MPLSDDFELRVTKAAQGGYFVADSRRGHRLQLRSTHFGAVVELLESFQAQQVGTLNVHLQVIGNAELSQNLGKLSAFDRDFAESSAQPLVARGRIAPDASPDVVVALKETDRSEVSATARFNNTRRPDSIRRELSWPS